MQPFEPVSFLNAQGLRLAGTLHRPREARPGAPAVILLSPGVKMRVGPGRLYVPITRLLNEQGYTVLLIEHNTDLIACSDWVVDMGPEGGGGLSRILEEGGVKLRPGTRLVEVTDRGIWVQDVESGNREFIEVDTVILALGVETNEAVYNRLKVQFPNVTLIGDATTPTGKVKRTLEAISEGYCTAMAV